MDRLDRWATTMVRLLLMLLLLLLLRGASSVSSMCVCVSMLSCENYVVTPERRTILSHVKGTSEDRSTGSRVSFPIR